MDSATELFIATLFGADRTTHPIEFRACPNERGTAGARSVYTRDAGVITLHIKRTDRPGMGGFFGVCTRRIGISKGDRTNVVELPAWWIDIDCLKLGLDKLAVLAALASCPMPPSIIVDSGAGLHCYWLAREAIIVALDDDGIGLGDAAEIEDRNIAVLKQLAGVFAGDVAVCDLARIMRLPGTHNSKAATLEAHGGEPVLVRLLECDSQRTYELGDMEEWLELQRPLVERPAAPGATADATPVNPFTAYAAAVGYKPPIDVESMLAAMRYEGSGDSSIHQTQLKVSASLVGRGEDDETVLAILLAATAAAAGAQAGFWNWRREERNIRQMIAGARVKFPDARPKAAASPPPPPPASPPPSGGSGSASNGDNVVNLKTVREAKAKPEKETKPKGVSAIEQAGRMVIKRWQAEIGPLLVTGGTLWTYDAGLWQPIEGMLMQRLRTWVQVAILFLKEDPRQVMKSNVLSYITDDAELLRETVEWDRHGLVICRNGALDPVKGTMHPHAPEHYATRALPVDYHATDAAPGFLRFLDESFADLAADERQQTVDMLMEFFGSALMRGKTREMTKALFLVGKTRSGKTQLLTVLRALVGGHSCGMRATALGERFGLQPLIGSSGWLADDAIGQNEQLDPEMFKIVVTGEPLSVARKNTTNWEGRLDIPVCLTANHLPHVRDDSDAVYNRSLVAHMNVARPVETSSRRPIGEILVETELPGILALAVAGYRRLAERGHYGPQPAAMARANMSFKNDNQPFQTFMAECIETAPGRMVDRRDIVASFLGWWRDEFANDKPLSARALWPAVRVAFPQLGDRKGNEARFATGIKLTSDGLLRVRQYRDNHFGTDDSSGRTGEQINRWVDENDAGSPRF